MVKWVPLYWSTDRVNAELVEAAVHSALHHLPLGVRLQRKQGARASKYNVVDVELLLAPSVLFLTVFNGVQRRGSLHKPQQQSHLEPQGDSAQASRSIGLDSLQLCSFASSPAAATTALAHSRLTMSSALRVVWCVWCACSSGIVVSSSSLGLGSDMLLGFGGLYKQRFEHKRG
eukprot:TRINITY_DN1311_c0_g1_i1.p1 TRINITY_DN1311_c0_g1~~TRINITY_DN1311_c0_g1_i1.p1  ORF type:complete len:174 (+),score=22.54 TRINITY_DN1311_c0_g1_i1:706-1227(+)